MFTQAMAKRLNRDHPTPPAPTCEQLEDRVLLSAVTVTSGLDSGVGTLRAAIEAANLDSTIDKIIVKDAVNSIELDNSLVYTGTQDLKIKGRQTSINTTDGKENTFDIFVSESTAKLKFVDLSIEDGLNGIVINVPDSATSEDKVRLVLKNVGIVNNSLFGVHMNDKLHNTDASVIFKAVDSLIQNNGTGALDYDGVRVDDGGAGKAKGVFINTAVIANGGDGVEIDETGDGRAVAIVTDSIFHGNGFYNVADLDDGLDMDEEGNGGLKAIITNSIFTENMDEGLDLDEAGNGRVLVNLSSVYADGNEDEGIKIDEEDNGSIELNMLNVLSNNSANQEGIAISEIGNGDFNVIASNVTAGGNAKEGIEITEEDDGDLITSFFVAKTEFNGGDGFKLEETGEGDLIGFAIDLQTVGNTDYGVVLEQEQIAGDIGEFLLIYLPYLNGSGPLDLANVSLL